MRLWHQKLISKLPRQQLLGQHREIAALRGNGWGRPHATVNYVFKYSPCKLYQFHMLVLREMKNRGYHPAEEWKEATYRGLNCAAYREISPIELSTPIYPEHNDEYLRECLHNLKAKGITFDESEFY